MPFDVEREIWSGGGGVGVCARGGVTWSGRGREDAVCPRSGRENVNMYQNQTLSKRSGVAQVVITILRRFRQRAAEFECLERG